MRQNDATGRKITGPFVKTDMIVAAGAGVPRGSQSMHPNSIRVVVVFAFVGLMALAPLVALVL
jgi:hypothetical protein